jgi:uncharacterized protein
MGKEVKRRSNMILTQPAGPFIKKFSDDGSYYVYDVNTNQVVEVEKSVYDIIRDYVENDHEPIIKKYSSNYNQAEIKESIHKIKQAREEYGLFSSFRPSKITMGTRRAEPIKRLYHERGLDQLLLELTGSCNLKCRYCNVSGQYAHSSAMQNHMSKETCRKAVDYFCSRANKDKKTAVNFYGGEPLLKFQLMEETVKYITKRYGDNYSFNITTNGTILDKDMADFFTRYDVDLLVSLDGPEHVNDRYRVTRDGKGTFHTIMKNLAFLEQYNPRYFARHVSISSVLAPPFDDIDHTLAFFADDDMFDLGETRTINRASFVDDHDTTFFRDIGLDRLDDVITEFSGVSGKFVQRLKTSLLNKDLSPITLERHGFYSILKNLALRKVKKLHDDCYPQGACHIGMRRLFVKTNGDFYVCERSGDNYKIGCIDTGIDYEAIAGYYRKQEEVLADCVNCWAIAHCERCWASVGDLEKFNGKKKEEFCRSQKAVIETALKGYAELLRKDPDCLKAFKDEQDSAT